MRVQRGGKGSLVAEDLAMTLSTSVSTLYLFQPKG